MADYDLVDPYGGSFRAKLAADWPSGDIRKPYGVSLNTSGEVVKGKGNSAAVRAVIVLTKARKKGEVVDCMRNGEITSFAPTAGVPNTDYGVAGTDYFAHPTTGVISATPVDGSTYVGTTAEGSRLLVWVEPHSLPVDVP